MNDKEKDILKVQMQKLLQDTIAYLKDNKSDVVIFDELLGALHGGFITKDEIADLVDNRPA